MICSSEFLTVRYVLFTVVITQRLLTNRQAQKGRAISDKVNTLHVKQRSKVTNPERCFTGKAFIWPFIFVQPQKL